MLDEFDVFMDPFNRKTSQNALISHAMTYKNHQFFLFTPLELTEMPEQDAATVLRFVFLRFCIHIFMFQRKYGFLILHDFMAFLCSFFHRMFPPVRNNVEGPAAGSDIEDDVETPSTSQARPSRRAPRRRQK